MDDRVGSVVPPGNTKKISTDCQRKKFVGATYGRSQ